MKITVLASRSCLSITLSIGWRRKKNPDTDAPPAEEKFVPSAKSYELSDDAAAAFLNDPEVIAAYESADFYDAFEPQYKEAIRLLDRKAAHYKAKFPKRAGASTPRPALTTTDDTASPAGTK